MSTIKFKIALLATGLGLLLSNSFTIAAYAQAFSGRGIPGRREGAGTRGCTLESPQPSPAGRTIAINGKSSPNLVALIPESNIGATLAAYPTFFWYVPANSLKVGRFTLYDSYGANRKKLYETRLNLDGTPGVISLRLPDNGTVPPLELNRTYYWVFRVFCDPLDRSGDLQVEGFVQRVKASASLEERLRTATARERPTIYAASGLWHETLISLVELRQANPNDRSVQTDWESLMQVIRLESLAKEAIVPCCQVQASSSR